MKLLFVIVLFLLAGGFALNRSYASIYQKIAEQHLINPNTPGAYSINTSPSTTKRLRYVAIGDSLTAGVGTTGNEESFPYLLSKAIARSGRNVELMNLGVPAAGTQDVIDSQLQKAISNNPDIVTILIGINDVQNFVSRGTFRRNIERIIDTIQGKTKARIVVINLPFLGTDDLVTRPFRWVYRLRVAAFNRILEQVAANKGPTLVDLNKATRDQTARSSDYYSIDQFHPSAKGYQQWSDIIYAHASF